MDKYSQYQTEDFLQDESFINWVLDPAGEANQAWTNWMHTDQPNKAVAQNAIALIRSFDFKKEPVAAEFYVNLKQRIDDTITRENSIPVRKKPVIASWLKAAAVVAG